MNEKDFETVKAMKIYGGGFVKKLAELVQCADYINLAKIKNTWPEYWKQYENMAENAKAHADN